MTSFSAITVTSSAFEEGASIPARFSCSGADISPEVSWSAGPSGTKSYALIMDDPDAPGGTFVHWVLYNLKLRDPSQGPSGTMTLPEGASGVAREGQNSFNKSSFRTDPATGPQLQIVEDPVHEGSTGASGSSHDQA